MTNNRILIIPSWYPTKEAPTSGSFFHEQSLLLENKNVGNIVWDVQILTTEKKWISRQRSLFYNFFEKKIPLTFSNQFLTTPKGIVIDYPFCKFISYEENLNREVKSILNFFVKHPEQKPNIIHAHCSLKGGVLARHLSINLGIPYIITEHMNPFLLHKYNDFWKKEIISCLEEAQSVLVVSEHQRQQLLMHELNCNPIPTGNLVDEFRFNISNEKSQNKSVHFLIVTYYPNFIKDINTFFEALLRLKQSKQIEGKHFTLVGGGELIGELGENYYSKKIKELNMQDYVTLVPKVNRDEMVQLVQQTDVLISTSIAESFGVTICEALLCGKPVISTLSGGVNDFLDDSNSIRIPIKNPGALQAAIIKMSQTNQLYDKIVMRKKIVEKYGRKAFRERMDDIYLKYIVK